MLPSSSPAPDESPFAAVVSWLKLVRARNSVGEGKVVPDIYRLIKELKIAKFLERKIGSKFRERTIDHQDRTGLMIDPQQRDNFCPRLGECDPANIDLRCELWIEVKQSLENGAVGAIVERTFTIAKSGGQ